jgi:hypothetical protein
MRKALALVVVLAACGGSPSSSPTVARAGTWVASPATGYMDMTLSVNGTTISGGGTEYFPTGGSRTFTVAGTTLPVPGLPLTFTYSDGTGEGWMGYSQSDVNHLDRRASSPPHPGPCLRPSIGQPGVLRQHAPRAACFGWPARAAVCRGRVRLIRQLQKSPFQSGSSA